MRIVAGEFKSRQLKIPKGLNIRPTSQKVKQALFNMLGEKIVRSSFLELFAGSGNVGIEAKSRGANLVIFVEQRQSCIRVIKHNLNNLGISFDYGLCSSYAQNKAQAVLLPLAVEEALKFLHRQEQKFDFIFLDPPYQQNDLKNYLIKIDHCDILNARSWLIAEHNKREVLPHLLDRLRLMSSKTYGDSQLSFYQSKAANDCCGRWP